MSDATHSQVRTLDGRDTRTDPPLDERGGGRQPFEALLARARRERRRARALLEERQASECERPPQ